MQTPLSTPISSSAATLAALADLSCITESLQLVESITRDWLKTESQKPTPPADPTAPGRSQFNPETASEAAIIRSLEAISAPKLMDLVSRKLVQHTNTEIKAIQARRESTAPTTITPSTQSTQSTHSTPSAVPHTHPISVHPAAQHPAQPSSSVSSIRNSPSASLPANSSLPPKFRYPPPKRVAV